MEKITMKTNYFLTFELWFLDLFIYLLSRPGLVLAWRKIFNSVWMKRQVFLYGIVVSVFGIMGFISGYIYLVLQMFGSR